MNSIRTVLCVAVLTVVSLAQAGAQDVPPVRVLAAVDVYDDGDELLLPVVIGGRTYRFGVDTGSSVTLYDRSLTNLFQTPAINAAIAGISLTLRRGAALDMATSRKLGGHDVRGLVGMDFLRGYVLRIDFDAGKLFFLSAAEPEGDAVPLVFRYGGRPVVQADITGWRSEPFVIDTGYVSNTSGFIEARLFDRLVAAGIGMEPVETKVVWVAGGEKSHVEALFRGMTLAKRQHSSLAFGRHPNVNLLGLNYLARYRVTFDFPNAVMYLKPSRQFGRRDGRDKTGLHLSRPDGRTIVESVDVESPAARVGVKSGDHLVRLDDLDCDSMRLYALRRSLAHCGGDIAVELLRGGERFMLRIDGSKDVNSAEDGEM
ncbi:MAG TPA: hypothetical protein VF278_08805 [Pirellulales bacterium]